jgi:hypothetical protein
MFLLQKKKLNILTLLSGIELPPISQPEEMIC